MGQEKQNRRSFLKKSGIAAAIAASGTHLGCASTNEKTPISESTAKSFAKNPADFTEDEIRAERRKASSNALQRHRDALLSKGDGKWKIHMLGTSAGSEPDEGHFFTSFLLEKPNGDLLMFDAGEPCAQTATLMGFNILRIKDIFISHPHSDHICGMAGFIHTCWAMGRICKAKPMDFTVHVSNPKSIEGAMMLAGNGNNKIGGIKINTLKEGLIYNDGDISVEAMGNLHMAKSKDDKFVSYSFRIKILGEAQKTIIYTGDIRALDEIDPWINEGCNLMLHENGHHKADKICKQLQEQYPNKVKELMIMHLSHDMKHNKEFELALAEKYWKKPIMLPKDRSSYVI